MRGIKKGGSKEPPFNYVYSPNYSLNPTPLSLGT